MARKLKIYGTRRIGHREHWTVKGKGTYKTVRRDKKGHFISTKKWSPKHPIKEQTFTELKPLVIEYETGKEAYQKTREAVREWEWIDFEAES